MARDDTLAAAIRELLPGSTEKRMFGGIAFLVNGKLAIAASGQGGVLVRVDPAEAAALVASGAAQPAVMHGRTLKGWVRAEPAPGELALWVERGAAQARAA
jgi:TfoX/Sxy family transcriptional regulator of competence genes